MANGDVNPNLFDLSQQALDAPPQRQPQPGDLARQMRQLQDRRFIREQQRRMMPQIARQLGLPSPESLVRTGFTPPPRWPGDEWGLGDPYAGIRPPDPLYGYRDRFDPERSRPPANAFSPTDMLMQPRNPTNPRSYLAPWAQMSPRRQPEESFYGPQHGPATEFAQAGVPIHLDPTLQGNVEYGQTPTYPESRRANLLNLLRKQSTGLAPQAGRYGMASAPTMPTNPPWVRAPQPGDLQSAAGFGDIPGDPFFAPPPWPVQPMPTAPWPGPQQPPPPLPWPGEPGGR